MTAPLTPGKLWGLRRIADRSGRFTMLAADQRPPIFEIAAKPLGVAPSEAPFADVAAIKRLIVETLAEHASAVLLDPNWAYPAAIDLVPRDRGLILTLEHHAFADEADGRRSADIPGWTVEGIRRLGADAVKVQAWDRPDSGEAARAHQETYVEACGRACALDDIPFVFELLLYPLGGDEGYATDPTRKAGLVVESVRHFADPRFGVDLFKLESPIPAIALPDPDGSAAGAAQAEFDKLADAVGSRPWVMLSAGAEGPAFARVLRYALRAGASGFLAGRAIWRESFTAWPDVAACRASLKSHAVPYLRTLNEMTGAQAAPWKPPTLRMPERAGEFVETYRPGR